MKQIIAFVAMCLIVLLVIIGALWISATEDFVPQEVYNQTDPVGYSGFDKDEIILYTLLEVFGEQLDNTYNPADLELYPYEKGNWVDDVASEMDWQTLIQFITNMPDFGTDYDYEMLDEITDGKWIEYNKPLN